MYCHCLRHLRCHEEKVARISILIYFYNPAVHGQNDYHAIMFRAVLQEAQGVMGQ